MEYLFVYGTLLKQFDNKVLQPLQNHLQLKGPGVLQGKMYDLGEYPGYIETVEVAATVNGEVYQVNRARQVFAVLDKYEGTEYSREEKLVRLDNDNEIRCWVYVYRQKLSPGCKRIMNGDYLAFIRNKG